MPRLLFDFTDPDAAAAWQPIDDRVMGGVSRSRIRHVPPSYAVFEGELSLQRNGGFASVRSSPSALGLAGAKACLIEVRGECRRYKLSLFTDNRFNGVSYQASFAPTGEDWHTLHLPLEKFHPRFRGREVPGTPALHPAGIRQVGLIIAEGQAGRFALDIRRLSLA